MPRTEVDLGAVGADFVIDDGEGPVVCPATVAVDPAEGSGLELRLHATGEDRELLALLGLSRADASQLVGEMAAALTADGGLDPGALRRVVDRVLWGCWDRSGRRPGDIARVAGTARDAAIRWGIESAEVV